MAHFSFVLDFSYGTVKSRFTDYAHFPTTFRKHLARAPMLRGYDDTFAAPQDYDCTPREQWDVMTVSPAFWSRINYSTSG